MLHDNNQTDASIEISFGQTDTGGDAQSYRSKNWPETKGVYERRERLNIFKDIRPSTGQSSSPKEARGLPGGDRRPAGARRGPLGIVLWVQARRARRLQGGLRRFQEGPRGLQDHYKTAQEASKTPKDAPKRPQDVSKTRFRWVLGTKMKPSWHQNRIRKQSHVKTA